MISYRQSDFQDYIYDIKPAILFGYLYTDNDGEDDDYYDITWILKRDGKIVEDKYDEDYERIGNMMGKGDIHWNTFTLQEWLDRDMKHYIMINLLPLKPTLKLTEGQTIQEDEDAYKVFAEVTLG